MASQVDRSEERHDDSFIVHEYLMLLTEEAVQSTLIQPSFGHPETGARARETPTGSPITIAPFLSRESPRAKNAHDKGSPERGQATSKNTLAPLKVQGGRIGKKRWGFQAKRQAALLKNLVGYQQRIPSNGDQELNFTQANLKILIRESSCATQFARDIAMDPPTALGNSLGPRIVLFPDGSGAGPKGINGAGVTYRHCFAQTTAWMDAAAGMLGAADNNDAELIGIGMALNIAKCEIEATHKLASGQQVTYPTIFIITDSRTALTLIHQHIRGNVTIERINRRLRQPAFAQILGPMNRLESLGVKLEFHWTKSHKVYGNNRADRLAGNSARWMIAQIGLNNVPRFAGNPYKIHMSPDTDPYVTRLFRRLFQDHKEDIALLLEGAYLNPLTKAPVLLQGDRGDGGLLSGPTEGLGDPEEPGKKGSRPAEKLKKMMSPLKGLVQTVTGQKRKHEETADSDSNSKKPADGKMTQFLSHMKNKLVRSHNANIEVIDLTNDDEEEESSTKLAIPQSVGDDQDESSSKLAISQNIGDNEGESSSKSAKPQNIDIEATDLAGDDDEESSSKTGYVIRCEAGREVIDLTEA